MIKRLKQSQVLHYLTHDRPVHFKENISIYFKTYFVSIRENGLFDMLYLTGGDLDLTSNIRPTIQDMRIMFKVL